MVKFIFYYSYDFFDKNMSKLIFYFFMMLIGFLLGFGLRERKARIERSSAASKMRSDEIKISELLEKIKLTSNPSAYERDLYNEVLEKNLKLQQENNSLQQRIAEKEKADERHRTEWRNFKKEQADEIQRQEAIAALNNISDPYNQMRFVSEAELTAKKPVNQEASKVLYALSEWIEANQKAWRMSFEVSMGAFIWTENDNARRSFNSKRVDFLLIDNQGKPMLVVEYHGTGHYGGNSADGNKKEMEQRRKNAEDRMAVKRIALARAGIRLLEVSSEASKQEIIRQVSSIMSKPLV